MVGWAVLLAPGAQAQADPADKAVLESARIRDERQQADARLAADSDACMGRFLLTACLAQAQTRHRQAIAGLDQRQGLLDSAARQVRAAQRRQAASEAAAGLAAKPAVARPAAARPAVDAADGSAPSAAAEARDARPSRPLASTAHPSTAAEAARRAQQKAADYAQRQQAAQAHREAVLARLKQQDAQRPPARPLPLPLPAVQGLPAPAGVPALPAPAASR